MISRRSRASGRPIGKLSLNLCGVTDENTVHNLRKYLCDIYPFVSVFSKQKNQKI